MIRGADNKIEKKEVTVAKINGVSHLVMSQGTLSDKLTFFGVEGVDCESILGTRRR